MLTEPLPSTLDVRKAAARGVSISGALKPLDLQRFRALLAGDAGQIRANLAFSRDEEGRSVVHAVIEAEVEVTCQRCLQPMLLALGSDSTLGIVWNDDQAKHLPKHLDPLIVTEEGCDLWQLVEEELMLALPSYSYHEEDDCNKDLAGYSGPTPGEGGDAERPNPFEVLAQLKPGNK
jgi:uncharacterized protein